MCASIVPISTTFIIAAVLGSNVLTMEDPRQARRRHVQQLRKLAVSCGAPRCPSDDSGRPKVAMMIAAIRVVEGHQELKQEAGDAFTACEATWVEAAGEARQPPQRAEEAAHEEATDSASYRMRGSSFLLT